MRESFDRAFCRLLPIACLFAASLCCGCSGRPSVGPKLNRVDGQVTLDGKPLPNASVVFTPKGGGRSAYTMTDENGKYDLGYSTDAAGTPEGEYVVSIKSGRVAEEDFSSGQLVPATPELVPSVYNVKSKLTVKVPGDSNGYNFDLKSNAGEIVQPEPEPK